MKALISPNENGRIAELAVTEFPIAEPLFWVDCADNVTTEWTYIDGVFSEPVSPPVPIPTVVSMRQARLALLQAGLLATVDAAIAAGTEADQITWEYATEVVRNSPLVVNLSASLGLSEQQLDELFTLAATL